MHVAYGGRQRRQAVHTKPIQKVVSVVAEGASFFEVATPVGVWGSERSAAVGLPVTFVACGVTRTSVTLDGGLVLSGLGLLADHAIDADMIVVPTWPVATRPIPDTLISLLTAAHARGARIVGLCLGAFAVAATGLLDHQHAVSHWRSRSRFEAMFPDVRFEANTLYVDNGSVVTSAGSAAAVDCCVHLVRLDHGDEAAAELARSLVTAPHRSGTQSQFAAVPELPPADDPLTNALSAAASDINRIDSVDALASLAGVGRRSIERHLQKRLGITPAVWIAEQRVSAACRLLETTALSVDRVAQASGYGSTPSLRRAMRQHRDTTPTAYRAAFGAK